MNKSKISGGTGSVWDCGPLGVELKKKIARGLVLLMCMLPSVAACRGTPAAKAAKAAQVRAVEATRRPELARRIALADADPAKDLPVAMWLMPPALHEISGLAVKADGMVLTHDDNVGRVYEIDPKMEIVRKSVSLSGNPHGDFEAITIAGSDVYLLESKGKIFKFREGADGQQVPYAVFDTGLKKECEFESMAFEADSARLLLVCKEVLTKKAPHELLIYRLPLPLGDRSKMSTLKVPIEDVVGSNRGENLHPSDINIDPTTKNYVIIASRERELVEITPEGEVVRSVPLPGDHRQAEGVAITRDRILMVSNEANVKPAAITLHKWRP